MGGQVLERLGAVKHLDGGGKWRRFHRGAMDSWPLSADSPIPVGNFWSVCPRKYCSELVRSSAFTSHPLLLLTSRGLRYETSLRHRRYTNVIGGRNSR